MVCNLLASDIGVPLDRPRRGSEQPGSQEDPGQWDGSDALVIREGSVGRLSRAEGIS